MYHAVALGIYLRRKIRVMNIKTKSDLLQNVCRYLTGLLREKEDKESIEMSSPTH